MQFLSISDPQVWLLAGISVLVVFSILVILVLILQLPKRAKRAEFL